MEAVSYEAEVDADAVLTKAAVRAATALGLTQRDLAQALGVSAATVSRFARGGRLSVESKEGELARLFIRAYRSLDALVGGDANASRQWLHAENIHLGGIPAAMIQRVQGLVRVVDYLDAMRGR